MSIEGDDSQRDKITDDNGVVVPAAAMSNIVASCVASGSLESFQDTRSLLLCPSQWTALLESPVSLVRHTSDTDCDSNGVNSQNEEPSAISNSPTVIERLVNYHWRVFMLHYYYLS